MLQPVLPLASLPDFNNEVAGLIHGYLFTPEAPPQRLNAREAAQLAQQSLPESYFLWLHFNLNHARAERRRAGLGQAQAMKAEADAAGVAFETALRDAQGKARDIAQTTRNELAVEAETKRKALEEALNAKLSASEATIRTRTEAAMGNVRSIAGEAASAIVERLTGQAPDRTSLDRALDATAH